MPGLKIAVLGPIPYDRSPPTADRFSEVRLRALHASGSGHPVRAEDVICPIVHVRRRDEDAIKHLLAPFANVDVAGISSRTDCGDVVELNYVDQNTRVERQTGFMAPIVPEDLGGVLDADAFVCVPITDYEVGLETLQYLKAHSDGLILLDGHGPTNSLTRGGETFPPAVGRAGSVARQRRHPQDEPGGGRL